MATTNILDSIAVARRSEAEAATILQSYIATGPQMTQTYTPQNAPTARAAPAPVSAPGVGGSGTQTVRTTTTTTTGEQQGDGKTDGKTEGKV